MASNKSLQHYRRGLVLGLTLAEIFLLFLFLLLIVFSYLLNREIQRWEPVRSALEQAGLPNQTTVNMQQSVATLQQEYNALKDVREELADGDIKISALSSFIALKDKLLADGLDIDDPNSLKTRLTEMGDAELIARKYEEVCGDIEDLENLMDRFPTSNDASDALATCPAEELNAPSLSDKPLTLADAQQVIDRLERTNKTLSQSIENLSGGRGSVFPPCWVSLEDPNKQIYIYNVSIHDDGVVVASGDDLDRARHVSVQFQQPGARI